MNKSFFLKDNYAIVLIMLMLTVLVWIAYWPVKDHPFIYYDDNTYVFENQRVSSGLNIESLKWAFTTTEVSYWHPLTWLSHMLDCEMFGLDPGMHHIINVFFHTINCLLLFWVLNLMTGRFWCSAVVALLFGLHPMNVETVAWIAERKSILCILFMLITLWSYHLYVQKPNVLAYLQVLVFYAMGLMTKPLLVTLPFLLILLDYWPLNRFNTDNSKQNVSFISIGRGLIFEKAPLIFLAVLSSLITLWGQHIMGALGTSVEYPMQMRLVNAIVSYARYVIKIIWPTDLSILVPFSQTIPIEKVIGASIFLIVMSVLVTRFRKKHPFLVTGWGLYLVSLIPVIGIVQSGIQGFANRYAYLSYIGVFIIISFGFSALAQNRNIKKHVIMLGIGILALVYLISIRGNLKHWQSDEALFIQAVRTTQENYLAHNNLGAAYERQMNLEQAIQHYKLALEIKSDFKMALDNLGAALNRQGRLLEAVETYRKLSILDATHLGARINLGRLYKSLGQTEKAISFFKKATIIAPTYWQTFLYLGNIYLELRRPEEAIQYFRKGLNMYSGSSKMFNNYGVALEGIGDINTAIEQYAKAIALNKHYLSAYQNIGVALCKIKRFDAAISYLTKALLIEPESAECHHTMGVAKLMTGSINEAITHFNETIRINPQHEIAKLNLAKALAMK